jgi:hypothetical protein
MIGENGHQNGSGTNGHGGAFGPGFQGFPSLPIVTPDPPRRSTSERYGSLFYLGVGGLAITLAMVGWFSIGVWRLRDVWANVYILHDSSRTEHERIAAAFALSRDPRANNEQRMEIILRKGLPEPARYIIAESLGADVVNDSPRGFPTMVAKSEGWPDWLRLLLTRPLALASADGASVPVEPLEILRNHPDRMIGLWAAFAEAVSARPIADALAMLDHAATTPGPEQELAQLLRDAARTKNEDEQHAILDRATVWMRTHHPEAARIWKGREVRDGKLIQTTER